MEAVYTQPGTQQGFVSEHAAAPNQSAPSLFVLKLAQARLEQVITEDGGPTLEKTALQQAKARLARLLMADAQSDSSPEVEKALARVVLAEYPKRSA